MDRIINATGSDTIYLWYYRSGKIVKKAFNNRTWIFVSGDSYDLGILEKSLDATSYIYRHTQMNDIYGTRDGIQIYLRPSKIPDIAGRIEQAFGYRLKIYNADINVILRFMATRNLEFYGLKNLYEDDMDISSAEICPVAENRRIRYVIINGRKYSNDIYREVYSCIQDNDIIVYRNYSREFITLLKDMNRHGYIISSTFNREKSFESYGRHSYMPGTVRIKNKICIDADSLIYRESGLSGIFELSRASLLPAETVSTVTPGTVVSAVEIKEALKRKILIPFRKDDYEIPKTPHEFFSADTGGIIFNPEPGIYENVYEIDFSSMYPGIIVNYGVSPENISGQKTSFLSSFLRGLLERRLFYKAISDRSDTYSRRNKALKTLLLNSFGYTGYKNAKFGRIDAHEKITHTGRTIIETAMRIAEDNNFRVLHGVVDSLWLSGNGSITKTINDICEKTCIPIVLDSHYKWIAFMPQNNGIGSANRYIGLRTDNTFKVRGIEMRRRDSPPLVKKFQEDALNVLKCEFHELQDRLEDLHRLKKRYMKLEGFNMDDFRIQLGINRHIEEYRVKNITYHLMKTAGYKQELYPGMLISGIIIDKAHNIILDRTEFFDRKYYSDLLERASRPFDFIISKSRNNVPYFN
ncbi:MAG: type B DNA-directed DNA polymerase [Ferroplasma sp.]|uniref:type B DNA-directed DNA polymerase n=1 Tax=Ferroplasma sp. TaxID=2591003 RepID=UPI002815C0CD|nr:type B DNA-directed DNA polymerase [Ferroplasma sp.]WMT51595.1 MAG: type B DNA-directed DNA polymerase [Ferroplasma sp.]